MPDDGGTQLAAWNWQIGTGAQGISENRVGEKAEIQIGKKQKK